MLAHTDIFGPIWKTLLTDLTEIVENIFVGMKLIT